MKLISVPKQSVVCTLVVLFYSYFNRVKCAGASYLINYTLGGILGNQLRISTITTWVTS